MPTRPHLIVEGFRLLSHLVEPLLAVHRQAVWLLPNPGFRRAAFASRGSLWDIADKTSKPEAALDNLLDRDRMFTERLRKETTRLDLRVIEVATTMSEEELTIRATEALAL